MSRTSKIISGLVITSVIAGIAAKYLSETKEENILDPKDKKLSEATLGEKVESIIESLELQDKKEKIMNFFSSLRK